MEFVQKTKGFSDKEEEEEEDEEEEEIRNFACNFFPHPSQMQWLQSNSNHSSQDLGRNQPLTASETINFHGKYQLMDLSLRIDTNGNGAGEGGGDGGGPSANGFIEREHMFDKVVTPSDVGKLNRLVIPKQHAEKYFPLDSSTNDKGLILNFEDRIGKPWRFRYSYWNSSQSYVMTKGWSRFVKDKKLDAGDIVSFHRGVGDLWKDRLYIDWRRRPDVLPVNNPFTNLHQVPNPLLLLPQSVRWGERHYTIPPSPFPSPSPSTLVPPPRRNYRHHHYQDHWQHMNYSNFHQNYSYDRTNLGTSNSLYYLRPSMASHMMGSSHQGSGENQGSSMVIESVPVIFKGNCNTKTSSTGITTSTSTAKRLRLFGVNMECAATATDEEEDLPNVVPIETDDQISTRGKEPFSINWNST